MCGITGYINLNQAPASPVILQKMTDAIKHRGPDGEGHWIEENVAIGHRRLSIIDLSPAGHQPMISSDHRYILTYNGEIYNYREIRTELEAAGYWFRSKTDSEVVLYAYSHWGKDALMKFNGMFALAIWDRKEKSLFLARDRYGIKPLYWAKQGKTIAFGSEQKAIMAQPGFQKKINKPALLEYFTFQNIFTNQTLLEDVFLFPAGHYATVDPTSGNVKPVQYWDYRFREPEKPAKKRRIR
jgi:asparagine synthase (glutamine-hydrolysing)